MTQADHYRDQSKRARRLAEAVKDPEASKKLIEMAEEFRLYAERLEQRINVSVPSDALALSHWLSAEAAVSRRSLSLHLPSLPKSPPLTEPLYKA